MVQIFSRDGALEIDTVTVSYLKDVSVSVDYTVVKEYDDDGEPEILEYGDVSYTFTAEVGYVDKTHADKVLNRTKVNVILYPAGNTSGKEKVTLSNAVCKWNMRWRRNAIVLQNISGEGTGIVIGTVT